MPPLKVPFTIRHNQSILSLGSCFAEHIGDRLAQRKFSILYNPFGVTFQPLVLVNTLQRLQEQRKFDVDELFESMGLWRHFAAHSRLAHPERKQALKQLNAALDAGHQQLQQSAFLFLTFGTAFTYFHQGKIVANNHQLPSQRFERRLITAEQMQATMAPILQRLFDQRPDLRVLVSVSPIRHYRDGLVANNRSKAHLILLAAQLEEQFEQLHYFPAYELLLDDLRDYRFFKADRSHPTEEAIDYVWHYFDQAFFTDATRQLNDQLERLLKGLAHRPRFPEHPPHQEFIRQLLEQIKLLETKYPFLDLQVEQQLLTAQLLPLQ